MPTVTAHPEVELDGGSTSLLQESFIQVHRDTSVPSQK